MVLGRDAVAFVAGVTQGPPRPSAVRELGKVGDWTVAVALYAFTSEADARKLRDHLVRARAWVIAAGEPSDDPIWTAHLESLNRWVDAQRPEVIIGLLGDEARARTWLAYGGREPVVTDAAASNVLAGLVRRWLQSMAG